MTTSHKLSRKTVAPLLALTFPDYTGRRCSLRIVPTYKIEGYQLCWDGGNRTEVRCVVLDGSAPRVVELAERVPWSGNRFSGNIPDNAVVVELHTMGGEVGDVPRRPGIGVLARSAAQRGRCASCACERARRLASSGCRGAPQATT